MMEKIKNKIIFFIFSLRKYTIRKISDDFERPKKQLEKLCERL